MTDKDKGINVFNAIDGLVDLYEDNKDTIKGVVGDDRKHGISEGDVLKQCFVNEDEVAITVEVGGGDISEVDLDISGDSVKLGIGDETITEEVPDDVDTGNAEAFMNNGVLEVTIPRNEGEE